MTNRHLSSRRPRGTHDAPILIGLALALLACSGHAQTQTGGLFMSMFGDQRAKQVGDTLQLLIVEATSASIQTQQKTSQDTSANIEPGVGKLKFIPLMGMSAEQEANAAGSTVRSGTVTARMTVQIVEITPTGNFIVEGARSLVLNSDSEVINVRGEVRPSAVTPENTIYSYDLANVEMQFAGSDPRRPKRKVGLLQRFLSFIF